MNRSTGHQLFRIVHDEDAADVEFDAVAVLAIPQVVGCPLRDEQQLGVFLPPSIFEWIWASGGSKSCATCL